MRYVDEYRQKILISRIAGRIRSAIPSRQINIMDVCGTHTQNFFRFGLDKFLPSNIRLISGPGCPVCVSEQAYIDSAIYIARQKDALLLTFGDMLRVPGTRSDLGEERASSGNIRVLYSPLDSIKVAKAHPDKRVVFLAVGFETTVPTIALSILAAQKEKIKNIFFLCALKLIPAAMEHLSCDKRLKLDGFLCPGHVSSIIGTKPYEFIPKRYGLNCCVAGFEPLDILEGIYILVTQLTKGKPSVANQYIRAVKRQGNPRAQSIIKRVFQVDDASWRGLGKIPKSGLVLRKEFFRFSAEKEFKIPRYAHPSAGSVKCRCADILKGLVSPDKCPLFAHRCTPDTPVGPCMVSHEGACNAYFKYRK